MLSGVRHTTRHTQTLPKGPSRHIDKIQPRRGMSFEIGVDLTEVEKVRGWEETSLGPGSVEDGGRMPFW